MPGYDFGAQMTAPRMRLLWELLWSKGESKLRVNIPETSVVRDGSVHMALFTGRDGRVSDGRIAGLLKNDPTTSSLLSLLAPLTSTSTRLPLAAGDEARQAEHQC
eukprot:COSAG01_NODE_1147_length_11515_cov_38.979694_1_plen_105_part_00